MLSEVNLLLPVEECSRIPDKVLFPKITTFACNEQSDLFKETSLDGILALWCVGRTPQPLYLFLFFTYPLWC